jgi:hypothetical protein
MVLDYCGAWFVDIVLKKTLADVQPRESEYTSTQFTLPRAHSLHCFSVITRGLGRREARRIEEAKEAAKAIADKKAA